MLPPARGHSQEPFLLCVGISAARLAEVARLLEGAVPVFGVPDAESARALVCGEAVYVEAAEERRPPGYDGGHGKHPASGSRARLGDSRGDPHLAGRDIRAHSYDRNGFETRGAAGSSTAAGAGGGAAGAPEPAYDFGAGHSSDSVGPNDPAYGLRVDSGQRMVTWQGRPIELSAREFDLIAALAREPGQVWTFADLIERVWGRPYVGDAETVVSAVKRLRRRIARVTTDIRVDSVRGVGFRLVAPS